MKTIITAAVIAATAFATPAFAKGNKVSAETKHDMAFGVLMTMKASSFCPDLGINENKSIIMAAAIATEYHISTTEMASVAAEIEGVAANAGQAKFCQIVTQSLISSGYGVYVANKN